MTRRTDYSRKEGSSRDANLAGLCWSSAHLVQCKPDEPSWTQTWVQALMPDYSRNWTKESSAIQWPPTWRCPSQKAEWYLQYKYIPVNFFYKKLIFFSTKDIRIALFLVKYYTFKIDIIRNYLLPNCWALKLCNN